MASKHLDGVRPRDLALDSSRAARVFGIDFHTLDAGLAVVCGTAAPQPDLDLMHPSE